MNYLESIKNWSDKQWRDFGLEFLEQTGWERDHTSDLDVFRINAKRFVVSFRHNIGQGAIGTDIESELTTLMKHASADGFVGFYSGDYTTSLCDRLSRYKEQSMVISGVQISVLLPYFSSSFIDRYFSGEEHKGAWQCSHYMNKSLRDYKPLYCMCGCQRDILADSLNIAHSAAYLYRDENDLYFIYGIKSCVFKHCDENTECGWIEINQILHPDQFNIWNGTLLDYLADNPELNLDGYYGPKRLFTSRILQRMRSVNAGFFLGVKEF